MSADQEGGDATREHLERLQLALKASNEGIWDWKPGSHAIYYSRRIIEFFECGHRQAPNLFVPPHDCIHAEDRSTFEAALGRALEPAGPEVFAVDARIRTGSDCWRWLRIRGIVVRDRGGEALRIAGSMIDINHRKDAEAQVEEERFQLRQLIDCVPVQIYFKDCASSFVLANQRMADWIGVGSTSAMVGRHDRDFFNAAHWERAEADEKEILKTRQPITGKLEHEIRCGTGEQTWVLTSKFPWFDHLGRLKGTFGVSSDVTDLVKAQREATALAVELQIRNKAYEEELQLAREIQQALASGSFPQTRSADGRSFGFGARYIPISGLAGDFYEVVPVNEHCVGMLICDVMGHGVRSALIVAMLRGLLEKQHGQATDPAAFLRGLNDGLASILERAGATMFATAFYAVADLSADTLRYACAGHPGPIVAGPGGVRQLAPTRCEKGPGLGLIPGAAYPVGEASLGDIERMILFTDGVLEAENREGEPFFEMRLMEIVGASAGLSLDGMLDAVLSSVLAFSEGQHFDDDVCLLAIEITSG
jgi:sigma-B regulation protein RsbU (phosphoserine phosphatase)